ncbi:MAG: pseudouridine synthase [Patescibacteria group bacterium]
MDQIILYPIRINKYLAFKKICSRREADQLIIENKIKINNRLALLGDKVNANDKVEISTPKEQRKKLIYFAYNKPIGIVTHGAQKNQKEIKDIVNIKMPIYPVRRQTLKASADARAHRTSNGVYPIGRLDRSSRGLIILTNDGRITDRILNPKYEHEKEYIVQTDKPITTDFLHKMSAGIKLDGFKTKKCETLKINSHSFKIIISEGKKHQIRLMCGALNYKVIDLKRIRIMNIILKDLEPNQYREIEKEELKKFLENLNL